MYEWLSGLCSHHVTDPRRSADGCGEKAHCSGWGRGCDRYPTRALLAGCGGKSKDGGTETTGANQNGGAQGGGGTGNAGSAKGQPAAVTVGKTVWFAGFKVTVGEATFTPGTGTDESTVAIAAQFENLGPNPAQLEATTVLTAGGQAYEATQLTGVDGLPQVPGGMSGKGNFAFSVDKDFSFADAVLTLGRADNNQAIVPLGGTGQLVTLEPKAVPVSGTAKVANLSVKVLSAELRADVPKSHDQIEKGKLALSFTFDVTNSSTFAGGYAFAFSNNLFLTLPDGTSITPESGPIELLNPVSTKKSLAVLFVVDAGTGSFQFGVREDIKNVRGTTKVEVPAF